MSRRSPTTGLAVAAAALAVALGHCAGPADASITFVKGNDVWIADDDGTGQYRVTTDGTAQNPWQSPSQADDGTIVAARKLPRSGPLYRMRQNGDLLNRIDLPAMQFGPFDPAVSPDGTTVAYTYGFSRYVNGWLETGTDIRYARTDGSGGTASWPGVSTGASDPSWIDASTVLAARGALAYRQRPGQPSAQWWSDYDHSEHFGTGDDLSDGEVAGERIVLTRGSGTPNTLQLYRVGDGPGSPPTPTCTVSDPADGPAGRRYDDPTLSGDGRRIVWGEGDGLWTATTPAGEGCDGWTISKLVDGASEPDWGPAPVAPGPRAQATAPTPGRDTTAPAPTTGTGHPAASSPATGAGHPGEPALATPPTGRRSPTAVCRSAREGAERERCAYRAALVRCRRKPSRAARASCTRQARRARARAACRRTTTGARLKVCLRRARR